MNSVENSARIEGETQKTWSYSEIVTKSAIGAGSGAVVGGTIVAGAFFAAGLTFGGPIAGGVFASSMGAGLASGSIMASLQAAAMTTTAYVTGAGIGGVLGGVYGLSGERGGAHDGKETPKVGIYAWNFPLYGIGTRGLASVGASLSSLPSTTLSTWTNWVCGKVHLAPGLCKRQEEIEYLRKSQKILNSSQDAPAQDAWTYDFGIGFTSKQVASTFYSTSAHIYKSASAGVTGLVGNFFEPIRNEATQQQPAPTISAGRNIQKE